MRYLFFILLLLSSLWALSKKPELIENDSLFQADLKECPISIRYPKWFGYPTQEGVVAFSNAQKSYLADGYDRICAYREMRVKGFRYSYSYGEKFHEKDSMNFFYLSVEKLDTTMLSLYDGTTLVKGNTYFLSQIKPSSLDTNLIYLCDIDPWDNSQILPNRTYAVGVQPFRPYNHVASWVTAEDNATKELVKKVGFGFASQTKVDSRDDEVTEVIRYEFDILVKNLRVERRWFNKDSFHCYVVVSCDTDDILKWDDSLPRASLYNRDIYGVDPIDIPPINDPLANINELRSIINRNIEERFEELEKK